MAGSSPWSVKGIASQERDLAKQAARRAGVPIGVWLSQRIREASQSGAVETQPAVAADAAEPTATAGRFGFGPGQWRQAEQAIQTGQLAQTRETVPRPWRTAPAEAARSNGYHDMPPYAPPPVPRAPAAPSIDPRRLKELEQRVSDLQDRDRDLATLRKKLAGTDAMEGRATELGERLGELAERMDALEARLNARFAALDGRLETLSESVEMLESRPAIEAPDADGAATTAPIERAVMRLSERLQRVEEITLPSAEGGGGFFSRLFRRR